MPSNNRNYRDDYRQELHYFSYRSHDVRAIQSFERFIKFNLQPFFSQADELGKIFTVSDAEMRAVINLGGAFRNTLVQLANTISMQSQNHAKKDGGTYDMKEYHEQMIFSTILYESNSLTGLINRIKKYLENLSKGFFEWNVVYYSYYENAVFDMSNTM